MITYDEKVHFSELMERLRNGESLDYTDTTIKLDDGGWSVPGLGADGSETEIFYAIHMDDLKPNQSLRFIHCSLDAEDDERLVIKPREHRDLCRIKNTKNFTVAWGSSADSRCEIQGREIASALTYGEYITTHYAHISGDVSIWFYDDLFEDTERKFDIEIHIQETDVYGSVMLTGLDLSRIYLERVNFNRTFTMERVVIKNQFDCINSIFRDDVSFGASQIKAARFDGTSFRKGGSFAKTMFLGDVSFIRTRFAGPTNFSDKPDRIYVGLITGFSQDGSSASFNIGGKLILSGAEIAGDFQIQDRYWEEPCWATRVRDEMADIEQSDKIVTHGLNLTHCTSTKFRMWVQDRHYQREMRADSRSFYRFWLWTTDCGRSFRPLLALMIVAIIGFGFAFLTIPECLTFRGSTTIYQPFAAFGASAIAFFSPFALGFGWLQPACDFARSLIIAEGVVAYIALSIFIGVLLSKMNRQRP
jgi:hypothetical protein